MEYQVVPIKGILMMSPIREQIILENQSFGWNEAQTEADFNNEYSEYYCLMNKDQLLGYIALHHILDEATINMVYIKPDCRQQGLATALLEFVQKELAMRDIQHLFLEVRESNLPAIKLYQEAQFEQLVIRKNYYQNPVENAIIMQKILSKGA